jgi:hypothetical protein
LYVKNIVKWWKSSPRVRFVARTIGTAIAAYIVSAWQSGITDYRAFVGGVVAAGITAFLGLLGLEPFVGVRPDKVSVPADQVKEV